MSEAPDIKVTDHAVLRWLERELGVPVEEIRELIGKRCDPYSDLAPVNIKIGKTKFVVVNGAVVTTLHKNATSPARNAPCVDDASLEVLSK